MPNWTFKCLHSPKLGNSRGEYEDAFLKPKKNNSSEEIKIAISDGASESSFAKEWANILVRNFKNKSFRKEHISETLCKLRKIWEKRIPKDLAWYALEKANEGAFAAFLGVTINLKNLSWYGYAVGDCCLFIIRDDKLYFSFPFTSSEVFSNNPYLISSNPNRNAEIEKYFIIDSGEIKKNDILIFATDAISAWFLRQTEKNEKPWNILIEISECKKYLAKFESWLNGLRNSQQIKNDDTTILILRFK